MELAIPGNLYGMAIAEPMHLNRNVDGNVVYFVEMARCYVMLIVNYIIQGYFLFQIGLVIVQTNEEEEGHEDGSLFMLRIMCVFVFQVTAFTELRDSTALLRLLWEVEAGEVHRHSGFHAVHSVHSHAGEDSQRTGAVMLREKSDHYMNRVNKVFRTPPPPDMPQWSLDKMSKWFKVQSIAVVGLPKLIIGGMLSIAGGLYIVKSGSTEDVILNTLAVNFVVEVDEILYTAFTPTATKFNLEHVKPIYLELTNDRRMAHWIANAIAYPLMSLSVTALIVFQAPQIINLVAILTSAA